MMSLIKKYFLFCFSIILILNISDLFAQSNDVKERRAREHQTVIDYMNQRINSSLPLQNNSSDIHKYSLREKFTKPSAEIDRKRYLMNGNNILVELWNYGGIGPGRPGAELRELLALVWKDAPYIFQFSPIVGAAVPSADNPNQKLFIVTDGLFDYDGFRDEDPATGFRWTWQPLSGYADPNQDFMASNPAFDSDRDGKPDSWPRDWYNSTLGQYVWPGYLVQGENNADLEVFWAKDDRDNREFRYFPFTNDSLRRGLGVQIDGRAFQWSNSLAANTLFIVWTITNVSDKDLDTVFFGIYGDPDVGGRDNKDDNGFFIPPYGDAVRNIPPYARSMVYFWDPDMRGDLGRPLGFLGCKFLESPGNPNNGIDDDGDGMIDERQDDGIDNDRDWNIDTDDLGRDGIANTADIGEGDGIPTAGNRLADGRPDPLNPGEPNFEYTDLDEADQIGLTSFNSWTWSSANAIRHDELVWNRNIPGNFGDISNNTDIVFTFGSGYISLKKGESKRISMAFLFGDNLSDLLVTAETVQDIYNKNYRFFRPPKLPKVEAVAGDRKVTLYWDSGAEASIDPITGKDFEGYVIYRSTRPDFADIQKITDGRASTFLHEPLRDVMGFDAKWDLINEWKGYHPVSYQGRGVKYYLGDNSGLRRSFVDSNNVLNGQTYYYAVVAYDHGDSLGIPPSETTKKISLDPITSQLIFDDNTVSVIPGPRAAGYITPTIGNTSVKQVGGFANGDVNFQILNDLEVRDESYTLSFSDRKILEDTVILQKNYSVIGTEIINEKIKLFDSKYANLSKENIIKDQRFVVKDLSGKVFRDTIDYVINLLRGQIRRSNNSTIPNYSEVNISYGYYSVYQSTALKAEDSNPVFDGIKVTVYDHNTLEFDSERSKWSRQDLQIPVKVDFSTIGVAARKKFFPGDYIITFSSTNIDSAKKRIGTTLINIPVKYKVEEIATGISRRVWTLLEERAINDSAWSRGDEMILFQPGASGVGTDTLTWALTWNRMSASDSVLPKSGDAYLFYSKRPFTSVDKFSLTTNSGVVDKSLASSRLDNIYVVPNPYVGANVLEPANRLPNQNRGERRIYFENLPTKCTIKIFTISGELVTTLEHESGFDNGRAFWNLLNRDGFSVAYGVYLAHIDAPEVGEKTIKFAIIK